MLAAAASLPVFAKFGFSFAGTDSGLYASFCGDKGLRLRLVRALLCGRGDRERDLVLWLVLSDSRCRVDCLSSWEVRVGFLLVESLLMAVRSARLLLERRSDSLFELGVDDRLLLAC